MWNQWHVVHHTREKVADTIQKGEITRISDRCFKYQWGTATCIIEVN